LTVPAAVALAVFAPLIIGTLFERGAFDGVDTAMTAQVLQYYVIGLPAYVAIKVFSTVHWAGQDTKTPVKIAVGATIFNVALSLVLIRFIGVGGIALATSLAGWLQVVAHLIVLRGRLDFAFDAVLKRAVIGTVLASAVMAGVAYGAQIGLAETPQILRWIAVVVSGGFVYGLSVVVLGVIKMTDVKRMFKR